MSELDSQKAFDYTCLDEAIRNLVQRKTYETHGLMKRTTEHLIMIGQNLLIIQNHLKTANNGKNGLFLSWLHAEFAMSQTTAYRFMQVAEKFANKKLPKLGNIGQSVLYELASSPDVIAELVESGQVSATIEAIREVKEALKHAEEINEQASTEAQGTQERLFSLQQNFEEQQTTIEQLMSERERMQKHLTQVSRPEVQIKEVEKPVVPPEITTELAELHQKIGILTNQRDDLSEQIKHLQEDARAEVLERHEGEHERRVRLHWYQITSDFHRSATKFLAQWPTPLDVLVFESDDWIRLNHTKELTRRLLDACHALTEAMGTGIVDSAAAHNEQV